MKNDMKQMTILKLRRVVILFSYPPPSDANCEFNCFNNLVSIVTWN